MARKQKKYHYIYKTINVLNGKYYLGMHSTDNIEDGYMGSGRRLKYSINKHGKENHKKEILEFLNSRRELKEREEELVNLNEITKKDCMNLKVGGEGGFSSDEHKQKFMLASKKSLKKASENGRKKIKDLHNNQDWLLLKKENQSKGLKRVGFKFDGFKDKIHSEETKKKMSEANTHQKGKNNSQYGTYWITDGNSNKKIKKDTEIPQGWYRGRKTK